MLSGKCFTCLMHCMKLSWVRLTSFSKPSDIAMCQKRNNSLCGMMVHAKGENAKRIMVFLLSGSSSSCSQQLTLRLVRALQSPSPSEIAKGQKRNNKRDPFWEILGWWLSYKTRNEWSYFQEGAPISYTSGSWAPSDSPDCRCLRRLWRVKNGIIVYAEWWFRLITRLWRRKGRSYCWGETPACGSHRSWVSGDSPNPQCLRALCAN